MKTILIVPHVQPRQDLRIRSVEIAKCLASQYGHKVYVLDWSGYAGNSSSYFFKAIGRISHAARTCREKFSSTNTDGITYLSLPHLLNPYPLALPFNAKGLAKLIREKKIDCLINANGYHFAVPRSVLGDILYIYDLVDDHLSPGPNKTWKRTRSFSLNEMGKANVVITISNALVELLAAEGFPDSVLVPNGVTHADYLQKPDAQAELIRKQYKIGRKYLISYIGNHTGWYSNMGFLLRVFDRLHSKHPETCLLVVGPVSESERNGTMKDGSVIFTGSVLSNEIVPFYHASDLGVLPFKHGHFTDNALPLKIVEYGAAKKLVIASPLRELETIRFPHVQLCPLTEEVWVSALETAYTGQETWHEAFTSVIKKYDWTNVLSPVNEMIETYVP